MPAYHIPFVADYGTPKVVAYEFDATKCAEIAESFCWRPTVAVKG
jgi:hypothetical protein